MAKCPVCGKIKANKQDLINHIESEHITEIPENMSTAQFIYYKTYGREYGLCRICKKPTQWNEKAGKPSQNCGSQKCKDKIREIAQSRMLKVYGKTSLMNDIKHQEKMLANRKISGIYTWSDNKHKFTYTGKYEKFAIEWLDKVMDLNPEKIQMPGPVIPYEYNGEIKYWITDIYLEDFNLIIEIKAGKDENTHPGFQLQRDLEDAKDRAMQKQNEYNYIKITHKSMMNLIKILSIIRMNNISDGDEKVIMINENINLFDTKISYDAEDFNIDLSNKDISSICETIYSGFLKENPMSVANISPITKNGEFLDKEQTFLEKLQKIKNENIINDDPQTPIFSPNQQDAPDPFISSNNFNDQNEEVIVDIENDPYNTHNNDVAEIQLGNISDRVIGQ